MKNIDKREKKEKRGPKEVPSETAQKMMFLKEGQKKSDFEQPRKEKKKRKRKEKDKKNEEK